MSPKVQSRFVEPSEAPDRPAGQPNRVDLHCHTDRSDGVLSPVQLYGAMRDCGLTLAAISDHDTLAGYRDVVAAGAVPDGLTLLPGVEINAIVTRDLGLWEGELHILGFGMDPDDAAFEDALARQRTRRRERFRQTVDRLRQIGLPIDAQVASIASTDDDAMGRPTVARALMAAGYASSVEDAFRRLLGYGCPAYVPREGLGPADAIAAITAAGGIAVLAHFSEAPDRVQIISELVDQGLGGLEVYYRTFDSATVERVGGVARSLGLLPTGGTDYHGDLGSYAESHAALWVPPEVGSTILERVGSGGTLGVP